MRKKLNSGFSSVELLVSMIVMVIVVVGVCSIFISKRKLDEKNREISAATQIAQRIISELKIQASDNSDTETFNNYRNLATGSVVKNISSDTFIQNFKTGNVSSSVPQSKISMNSLTENLKASEKKKFVAKIQVLAGDATLTQILSSAGSCPFTSDKKVYLDIDPSALGIINDGGVKDKETVATLISLTNNSKDNIYAKSPNDAEKSFIISISCSANDGGRKNVKNDYNVGDVLIARTKSVQVQIFYADKNNIDNIADPKPIVTLNTNLNIPM